MPRPDLSTVPSQLTRSILALTLLVFACLSIACGGELGGVPAARFSVEVTEIDIENNCDPASNANGGDFRMSIALKDTVGHRMASYPLTLIAQSKVARVVPLDVFIEGDLRLEPGRTAQLEIELHEDDGGGFYEGRNVGRWDFAWSPEDGCWVFEDDPSICLADGDTFDFTHALDDTVAPICRASVSGTLAVESFRSTPIEIHAGGWGSSGDLRFGFTPVAGGDTYECLFADMNVRGGGLENGGLFEGDGECARSTFPSGIDYEFSTTMRFLNDTEVEGTIVFETTGDDFVIPFEGTRTLDTIDFTFSAVMPDARAGGDLGDVHWMGAGVLRQ